MGRPWPQPGEPLFLTADTDLIIALAEEERDTCPSCGMPKAWCRDPANQFGVFVPNEEQCHVTYALAVHRQQMSDKRDEVSQAAVQTSARFRDGFEPDMEAGLDLLDEAAE
jgi:uncharacterized protein YcgI (DUF1989 family)